MRNPFKRDGHDPERPAPGGIDGVPVDYVRWYPPDTPFLWGQGFEHAFTNVPAINGGRWINEFLPDSGWELPFGVLSISHMWPAIVGTDGVYQKQLNWGGSPGVAGPPMATVMEAFGKAQARIAADISSLAGSFARQ